MNGETKLEQSCLLIEHHDETGWDAQPAADRDPFRRMVHRNNQFASERTARPRISPIN